MIKLFCLFLVLLVVAAVTADQKCSGSPRKFRNKPCASTTRYTDKTKGACGCGTGTGSGTGFSWNLNGFTTAPNEAFYNDESPGPLWCGRKCGRCFRLTPTGGFVPGQGGPPPNDKPVVVMVTNVCPRQGNMQWCGQTPGGGTNQYGYATHFDIEDLGGQLRRIGWNNPEVTWEEADCAQAHRQNGETPGPDQYKQCQCHKYSNITIISPP
ncbi:endoglucanase [Lingula anatina]|uniref:Endoglucanase n=1 Tax=Lingula anatina TaxID=7574 RepID=A0A1S3H5Q2_LINAN|nr:endoglucanase [Lingula anatina]|eukprot:XP_013381297.1 endoglucanase [Lingula anatina]